MLAQAGGGRHAFHLEGIIAFFSLYASGNQGFFFRMARGAGPIV
jgi:hypothetical protein